MADFDLKETKSTRSKANSRIPNEREEGLEEEEGGERLPASIFFRHISRNNSSEKRSTKRGFFRSTLYSVAAAVG